MRFIDLEQPAVQPHLEKRYSVCHSFFTYTNFYYRQLINYSYVGTLHEINPEASTIALENVVSHGTEGRRGNPSEEIPASTTIYEYIVFRGSDVKDISVAEEKKEPEVPPSQVPDDPAILGVSFDHSSLPILI